MYEAPDFVALGDAHELIRGQKPTSQNPMDSLGLPQRAEPIDDIDEVDD